MQAQGDDVVTIPGTKKRHYLEQNVAALDLELTADELARLRALQPTGDRSNDMEWVERDTPAKV